MNNTLVELSEKIKISFDSSDASVQDLMNQLTQANNTITQLNTKYKVASGTGVFSKGVNQYANYYDRNYGIVMADLIKINGLNFVPNIVVATLEFNENNYFYKYLVIACVGVFSKDFVINSYFNRRNGEGSFLAQGDVFCVNEREVYINNSGIQLPVYSNNTKNQFAWCAIKFK
ncbi:Uncharacterised protein [Clostridioides difficile]|nr:Uncharacterised protein [Clostridioides difficile]